MSEMEKKANVFMEDTRFIFKTNFSGDPERDSYGSEERKANIIIPTEEQANELAAAGFNVKVTKPKEGAEEDFIPVYFISIKVSYESEWPPKIYLVVGDAEPRLLDGESIDTLDKIYITNVKAVLNPYYSRKNDRWSLYVKTLYVEQDIEDDPYAASYRNRGNRTEDRESLPFN